MPPQLMLTAPATARINAAKNLGRMTRFYTKAWRQPFDAMRIVGNVYYVGTRGLSSFLIVTPAGGIIIDSGEAESVPFIRASVEKLGFRLSDVKILLTGHAHFDHVGGHADLKRLTGAKIMVMDADREALESGGDRSALGGPDPSTSSGQGGGVNPFVDPDGYQRFVERSEQAYLKQLAQDRKP